MSRSSSVSGLSLIQLEKLMQARRAEVIRLSRIRDKLQKKLEGVEKKLIAIAGDTGGKVTRPRNHASLQEIIYQVLQKAGKPLGVGDILDKVHATGYRSKSSNFRGIVNQTLIKDKRLSKAGRGLYQLKK
jgi:hypothetical protein